mmetsp:Transcript_10334/g.15857  ORF Transcript_10334/g.15857 Transcript_10334/m.15857 type:complete len:98 (-) Transcript_10334:1579-1872(-)
MHSHNQTFLNSHVSEESCDLGSMVLRASLERNSNIRRRNRRNRRRNSSSYKHNHVHTNDKINQQIKLFKMEEKKEEPVDMKGYLKDSDAELSPVEPG